ncbi:MAG: tetratricopeptide repeat protein [Candidatus Competibacterales bacterium]
MIRQRQSNRPTPLGSVAMGGLAFWLAVAASAAPAAVATAQTAPVPVGAEVASDALHWTASLNRGDYPAVIARAREQLAAGRGDAAAALALGEALTATGQLEAAAEALAQIEALVAAGRGTPEEALVARYRRAVLDRRTGSTARARATFAALAGADHPGLPYDPRLAVAGALRQLGDEDPRRFHDAVGVYGELMAAAPRRIEAFVALADLLLAKYNNAEAAAVVAEAEALDPDHPALLLVKAKSQHFDFRPEALATAEAALAVNPRFSAARALLAKLLLESERFDAAETQARTALTHNPADLEALAVLATLQVLRRQDRALQATEARARAVNPRPAAFYNTLAEQVARNRHYQAAVDFAEQAVELDPRSWRGHGLLGLNLMRLGRMAEGRDHLERAFAGDPFNVWIKNTLDLADTFTEYRIHRTEPFDIVVHRDEAAVLTPLVAQVAHAALAHFQERYGVTLEGPLRIEIYPHHGDFSVRTVGLAGLGALGVSFGPVVAMDSPTARPRGSFHWASTLWHELAHSFHIKASQGRVPRWFSEGLAVYEEQTASPGWGGDPTAGFLMAYRDGRLPPVSRLNEAFVRPAYPEQVIFAYYLASQVVAYIHQRFGFEAINALLAAYSRGASDADAVTEVLGIAPAALDRDFDAHLRRRFQTPLGALTGARPGQRGVLPDAALVERAKAQPDTYLPQLLAGHFLLKRGDLEEAEVLLRRAQALFPEDGSGDGPYALLAELYQRRGESAKATAQLAALTALDADNYQAHRQLATLRAAAGDVSGAIRALEQARFVDPFDPSLHLELAGHFERTRRYGEAVAARQALIDLSPADPAAAHYHLARALHWANRPREARQTLLIALERAPSYLPALELLLTLHEPEDTIRGNPYD